MKKLTLLLAAAFMISGGAIAHEKSCCKKKGEKCTKTSCCKDKAHCKHSDAKDATKSNTTAPAEAPKKNS